MNRAEVLDTAKQYTTKDRKADHGPLENTFTMIADLWSVYLDLEIGAADAAMMLALLKIARQRANPNHSDNYVDLAGYAACAGELSGSPALPPNGLQG